MQSTRIESLSSDGTFDLRALDITSPVDDNLICSVCHCAFIKPVITSGCEHIFCADCFESTDQQQSTTCPFCRSKIDPQKTRPAPRALSNMVDDLKVKCPLWRDGCEVISSRGTVQAHVEKYCKYAQVDCPENDCVRMMPRGDLEKGCRHHPIDCQYCHDSFMEMYIEV